MPKVKQAKGDEKEAEQQYEKIAKIRSEELAVSDKLKQLETECKKIELTADDLASVIEVWTGVPASSVSENEFKRIEGLEDRLKQRIVGQDEAVEAVTRAVKRSRAGISYKRKPVSFIFAGPTGVGQDRACKGTRCRSVPYTRNAYKDRYVRIYGEIFRVAPNRFASGVCRI